MNKRFRKVLSLVLTVCMTASLFTGSSWASVAGQLFEDRETPWLMATKQNSGTDLHINKSFRLASASNAAIASDSNAELKATPSNGLKEISMDDVSNGSLSLTMDKYDIGEHDGEASWLVPVELSADGRNFIGDVELRWNWFKNNSFVITPSDTEYVLESMNHSMPPVSALDIKITGKNAQEESSKISYTGGEDNGINYLRLDFGEVDRTTAQNFRIEVKDKTTKKFMGFCDITLLSRTDITIDGEPVEDIGLRAYIKDLKDKGKADKVKQLTIDGGTMVEEDWQALRELSGLKRFEISANVVLLQRDSLNYEYFSGMTSLEEVYFNQSGQVGKAASSTPNITEIGGGLFKNCTNLRKVEIPGVLTVGHQTFLGCTSLTDINMPDAAYIEREAFINCISLQEISMPSAIKLGDSAFEECKNLKLIDMPAVSAIGTKSFFNCTSLTELSMPSVSEIDDYGFKGCSNLKSVKMPRIRFLFPYAFSNCTTLEYIAIGEERPWFNMHLNAFEGVTLPLRYDILDEDGKELDEHRLDLAIDGYRKDEVWRQILGLEINKPDPDTGRKISVTGTTLSGVSFDTSNLKSLSHLTTEYGIALDEVEHLNISGGTLVTEDWNQIEDMTHLKFLYIRTDNKTELIIRDELPDDMKLSDQLEVIEIYGVKNIPAQLFKGNDNLRAAYFATVENIGSSAFEGCTGLYLLTLPQTPPELGSHVFKGCSYSKKEIQFHGIHPSLDKERYAEIRKLYEDKDAQWMQAEWFTSETPPTPPPTPTPEPSYTYSSSPSDQTGRWILDEHGWWYREGTNSWPSDQWKYLYYNGSYAWYYFDRDGYMVTGWYTDRNGSTYYLHPAADGASGHMYTGWHQIDGKWYYFNASEGALKGMLLKNTTTPDGYLVDENGIWVQ